jgi:hypothetical protein
LIQELQFDPADQGPDVYPPLDPPEPPVEGLGFGLGGMEAVVNLTKLDSVEPLGPIDWTLRK